jgi:alpha-beta hydrolase superfamily lysophospholipase
MPEQFQPDLLRAALRPLTDSIADPAQFQAYQAFYGLDFSARHPQLQSRLGFFQQGELHIAVQCWMPPQAKASLLLLHGLYDHMGLFRHVIAWALDMGFAVLACDLPGHGLSDGERASIDDFAIYQGTVQGLLAQAEALDLPRPWHLFGQSTGAGILIDYLLNGTPRAEIGASIFLAPLVRPYAWTGGLLSYYLLRPFVRAIPRRYNENSHDTRFLEFLRSGDPLQPRQLVTAWVGAMARWIPRIESAPCSTRSPLIVQGGEDRTVDGPHNLGVLKRKFQQPDILLLPEARHHLANESEALRERYFAFLSERLRLD